MNIDWNWVLAKGLEGAPAAAFILLMVWIVCFCGTLLKRTVGFLTRGGPKASQVPPDHQRPRIRKEPTFPPTMGSRTPADVQELAATVKALQARLAALEQHVRDGLPASKLPTAGTRLPGDGGETVVSLEMSRPSRRKIDLG